MASKSEVLEFPLSANDCYELFLRSSSRLKEFKITTADKGNGFIQIVTGSNWGSGKITTKVLFEPIDRTSTRMVMEGSLTSITDIRGLIPKTLDKLLDPFNEAVEQMVHAQVREGLICPTCGRSLKPGTKFCPEDGTQIAIACPKCNTVNAPGAKFCVNCGEPQ